VPNDTAELTVWVRDATADPYELDAATTGLRQELLDLDVSRVEPLGGTPPPTSKGVEAAVAGALLVTICRPEVLTPLVTAVRTWLGDRQHRTVRLKCADDELEVTGLSGQQQQQLIDAWLARQTGGGTRQTNGGR
jgi:hypothetical protein